MTIRGSAPFETGVDIHAPLETVHHSHDMILGQLAQVREIAPLANALKRAASVAADTVALFENEVLRHHADEENDLFPAVIRSARPGHEREWATLIAEELKAQHRAIERLWKTLHPQMRTLGHGRVSELDTQALASLVAAYEAHASREEIEYLPRAQEILSRDGNHLAALGISFHLRRTRQLPGYI
jgi:hemerythrin-like domain-containing protein